METQKETQTQTQTEPQIQTQTQTQTQTEPQEKPNKETEPTQPNPLLIEEEELTLEDLTVDTILSLEDLKSIQQLNVYAVREMVTSKGLEGTVG